MQFWWCLVEVLSTVLVMFGGGPQYNSWWCLVEVLIAVLCSEKPIRVRPESVFETFS